MIKSLTRYSVLLCFLLLVSCKTTQKQTYLADIDARAYQISDRDTNIDQGIDDLIKPYRNQLTSKMEVVLIENEIELRKSKPNSNMGGWLADVIKDIANANGEKVDFAVQNYGGMRIPSIAKGNVTVGKIYELMPFDNLVVVLEADGSLVKQFCDHLAQSGGWPISDGLEFTIKDSVAQNILVSGEALDLEKSYRIAMPDYVANGGNDCKFFMPIKQEKIDIMIRDGIIGWLKDLSAQGSSLHITTQDRIHE